MEEAFPIRFTRGIRSYWRRRKYQRLDGGGGGRKSAQVARLGDGRRGRGGARAWAVRLGRVFRARVRLPTPMRVLGRIRDAYVDAMLGVARRAGPGLSAPNGPEALWGKRVPRALPARPEPTEFEQRLILEIYKSIVASKELTGMLEASVAR